MKIFLSFLTLSLTFSSLVSAEIFDWDQNKDYNAGVTVVVKEGDNAGSYRSLQSVSAGTPITSTDFWYNLFLESNLPDYVKAGENPDEEGLSQALQGGTPNTADIPKDLPPNTDTSTGGGDTNTGGGDTSTGGGDTSTGGGDTSTGGGDTSTGGGDTNTGDGSGISTFTPGYRRDGTPMDPSIPTHFDVDGYYDRNHDVRDVFQNLANDGVLAYNHYLDEGVTIDRMFDNNFVPREYLNIYVDLKVLFTDSEGNIDLVAATIHWFNYGRAEGRKGRFEMPEWFDAQAYRDTHHDVRDALAGSSFGEDTEAWWHFYRTGAPLEGRSFDDTRFNLDAYIASNPDLKVFFRRSDGKIDKKAAMYHYISDGQAEGRVDSFSIPTWFDVQEYKSNNPDVAAAPDWNSSDFLIFNHFYRFGAPLENRTLSNFNLTKYIELNADIANFYGSTTTEERRECMIHYMADGFAEGRRAVD